MLGEASVRTLPSFPILHHRTILYSFHCDMLFSNFLFRFTMELRKKSGLSFSVLFQHLRFAAPMFAPGLEVFSHLIFSSLRAFHRE